MPKYGRGPCAEAIRKLHRLGFAKLATPSWVSSPCTPRKLSKSSFHPVHLNAISVIYLSGTLLRFRIRDYFFLHVQRSCSQVLLLKRGSWVSEGQETTSWRGWCHIPAGMKPTNRSVHGDTAFLLLLPTHLSRRKPTVTRFKSAPRCPKVDLAWTWFLLQSHPLWYVIAQHYLFPSAIIYLWKYN